MKPPTNLPAGLVVHCAQCNLVVPSDAPQPPESGCEFVALHRLAFYNPKETIAGQHVQAVATWALIYDTELKAAEPASVAYRNAFRASRKAHFGASAVRKGMTQAQVDAGVQHPRDRSLYL
jgi:hypothetical protein